MNEQLTQIARKALQVRLDPADSPTQHVIGQHGRNGDCQPRRGHDQRFTHWTCDDSDVGRTGGTDRDQRVVNAPHRTEQANEWCRRSGGGEPSEAVFQLRAFTSHGLTQGAIAAILVHGSDEQKAAYLPKMVEGTWTGTLNLTCGGNGNTALDANGTFTNNGGSIATNDGSENGTGIMGGRMGMPGGMRR